MTTIFKPVAEAMEAFFKSCRRWPSVTESRFLLALILIGLFGNYLNVELFIGVSFIFGSVATMIALRMSGPLWGTLVGIIIGSYSYVLWGHAYAIIIFGLEAFFVGTALCCLKKDNMILIDVGYWLLIGLPLFWVLYLYQMGLPDQTVILIGLKQMINGITNVVLASLLLQFTPLTRWIRWKGISNLQQSFSMYSAINVLLAAFILLPMLFATIITGKVALVKIQEKLKLTVEDKARESVRKLSSTLTYYPRLLESMVFVEQSKDPDNATPWISTLKNFDRNVIPGLLNTKILSDDGKILFSYPVRRSGTSEHANQISLVRFDSDYLSSVQVDEYFEVPHFTMISPISEGRFLASTFSLKIFGTQLSWLSQGQLHIELNDGQGYILASSGESDLSEFVQGVNPHHLLPSDEKLLNMVSWMQSYWQDRMKFIGDNGWSIRVAAPMSNSIVSLKDDYIRTFMTMLIISVGSLLLVPLVSRMLSSPLNGLTRATDMFSSSIGRSDVLWPNSNIIEINLLVQQFQAFVQTINQNQRDLSQSEQRYAVIAKDMTQLVDTTNAPIFGIDAQGKVNEWNQQAENITGFKKNEVMGLDLVTDFITDDFKASVGKVLERALRGKETANYEFPLFTKSGDRVDVLLNSTTRRDAIGQIVGVVGVGQDITELNKIQVEQERERKEASAKIIQTSKLATLGEMATSVAHELNQPLSAISMAAGNGRRKISKGTVDPVYLNDKFERIEAQAARASVIIDHMRMFGREAKEAPDAIDPRQVITNALDLMGAQLRLVGIEIVIEFEKECSFVLGHIIQMEQVILNLLSNARDAMLEKESDGKIILRVFEKDDFVYITSEDTGGGIPEAIMHRIFEPFFTTKKMGKGTGLGLSVSYGIVHDMEGSIMAENINYGTRFTITLPVMSKR
jgi:PAS domain S-box-containing protein